MPYNAHLLHDIGAFVLGLGAILGAALVLADGLAVALAGATVASAAHAVAHVIDHDLGGKASDPYTFAALARVFVALLLARLRQLLESPDALIQLRRGRMAVRPARPGLRLARDDASRQLRVADEARDA